MCQCIRAKLRVKHNYKADTPLTIKSQHEQFYLVLIRRFVNTKYM